MIASYVVIHAHTRVWDNGGCPIDNFDFWAERPLHRVQIFTFWNIASLNTVFGQ